MRLTPHERETIMTRLVDAVDAGEITADEARAVLDEAGRPIPRHVEATDDEHGASPPPGRSGG